MEKRSLVMLPSPAPVEFRCGAQLVAAIASAQFLPAVGGVVTIGARRYAVSGHACAVVKGPPHHVSALAAVVELEPDTVPAPPARGPHRPATRAARGAASRETDY